MKTSTQALPRSTPEVPSVNPNIGALPDARFIEKHILCASDLSEHDRETADLAALLAVKQGVGLKVQFFAPELVASADFPEFEKWDAQARQKLEAERVHLSATCPQVATVLSHGDPGFEIAARSNDHTNLIVAGTTAKGRLLRWLAGSTAERIAEHAPAPTLVVKRAETLRRWLKENRSLRVLCAVDFSVSSDAALSALNELRALGGEIDLHAACIVRKDAILENMEVGQVTDEKSREDHGVDLECDLWERLHAVLGQVNARVHVRSTDGSNAQEFLRLAEELHADLLVVGTHQTHGMRRLVTHSFSREVLARSSTNVLCVPLATYHPGLSVPAVHRVLVATDFSENGNAALQHAYSLLPSGGDIKVVHVCAAPDFGAMSELGPSPYLDAEAEVARNKRESEEKLKALIPGRPLAVGVRTTSEVLLDLQTASAICKAAERFGADVICVGTRSARIAKALLGSVSSGVIAHAHVPVLVVPTPKI
jgi:nucleotide-binding universal stress UspA family protein